MPSWRNWLSERICDTISTYHADAYFLDIAADWENNTKADMHEDTRLLVEGLRKKFSRRAGLRGNALRCVDEFYATWFTFSSGGGYPPGMKKYVRAFQHLSLPAPGRGSSGVHESGFAHFNPKTLSLAKQQIPTIIVVDDTSFEKYREVMAGIIRRAKTRGSQ